MNIFKQASNMPERHLFGGGGVVEGAPADVQKKNVKE
jgi:hypothetical protein